jgi:hypothetical protein
LRLFGHGHGVISTTFFPKMLLSSKKQLFNHWILQHFQESPLNKSEINNHTEEKPSLSEVPPSPKKLR